MELSDYATPKQLITYVEELVGGEYGEPVDIYCSQNTISMDKKDANQDDKIIARKVCGYVAYLLGVGFTNFPGCSEKDSSLPKKITPKTMQEFKRRTAYLLPKISIVTKEVIEGADTKAA